MMRSLLGLSVIVTWLLVQLLAAQSVNAQAPKYAEAIQVSRAAAREMVAESSTPGIGVAVAAGGEIVWSEGFGYSDLEKKVPVNTDTKFALGSISKSLTTAAFARLVEQGKTSWDQPIEQVLPGFPHRNKNITPRSVAGHASGLGDDFGTKFYYSTRHFSTTDEVLAEVFKEKLQAEPGTKHFYATTSYGLLAGIIEKSTELDFESSLKDLVLKPLQLDSIEPNHRRKVVSNRTDFYVLEEGRIVNAPFFDSSHKLAGAGYLSTAEDLAKFGVAMSQPGFLKQDSLQELFQPIETKEDGLTEFALGWRIGNDAKGRRVIHQPGGGIGISCWIWIYPDEEVVIAILANRTTAPVGGKLFAAVSKAFLDAE